MPTNRQKIFRHFTRLFPFYSGGGKFANSIFIKKLTGPSNESVWADVPGGKVFVPLGEYTGRTIYYVGDLDPKITWLCSKIVKPGDTYRCGSTFRHCYNMVIISYWRNRQGTFV